MLERIVRHHFASIVISRAFRVLDAIWSKENKLVIFCGGQDVHYSDNSRYLYERFVDNYCDEFDVRWVATSKTTTEDPSIPRKYRSRMIHLYSKGGYRTLLRARIIFYSFGFGDLPGTSFSKRTTTIQLWHGIPIKRIGLCRKDLPKRTLIPRMRGFSRFTYWIASSEIERNAIALCTGLPQSRIPIVGYPRNDLLVEGRRDRDPRLLERFPFLEKIVILYAPTYRRNAPLQLFPFDDFDIERLIEFLEEMDAQLILRTHHVDESRAADVTTRLTEPGRGRIVVLNRDEIRDVQDLLPHVDIMISDYSGIWIDFLLLDRPVVFVPYDLAQYEKDEGLLFNYDDITPGPKVRNLIELLSALGQYISNPAKDAAARAKVKQQFHRFEDGESYSRIHQIVKDELSSDTTL